MILTKCAEVIKKESVRLDGSFCLGPAAGGNVEFRTASPASVAAVTAAPQAKIIENHSDRAIIEITCVCGCKNHIECCY